MKPHDPSDVVTCNWRTALDAFIAARMNEPFAWGRNDCCLFAADAVLAMTGVDHAADARGSYGDAAGAARTLQRLGGIAAVGARAGAACAPAFAQPGDVGLVEHEGRATLAVCHGSHWLAPVERGIGVLPFAAATQAWRGHA